MRLGRHGGEQSTAQDLAVNFRFEAGCNVDTLTEG